MSTEAKNLRIADNGQVLNLSHMDALAAHSGESWFGVAVGFRMLQAAGRALSEHQLWDRKDLFVVSGHPGSGVRDVIEHVTGCVSRKHFYLQSGTADTGCNRAMQFVWEVGNGLSVATICLRDHYVPETLYTLLDRRGTEDEQADDARRFAALKHRLAQAVWDEPLSTLFDVTLLQAGAARHA